MAEKQTEKKEPRVEQKIGVIEAISFGSGGYQNAMFGLTLLFKFPDGNITSFVDGGWKGKRPQNAKWTERQREKQRALLCDKIIGVLNDAKVDNILQLRGKPVEVMLENDRLTGWRILTEAVL